MAEKIGNTDKAIKKYLSGIDNEMDEYKESYISKRWDEIPDFYLGRTHWPELRPSYKVSPVLNFLKQAIEKKTSQMTDAKPFMDILPFYDPLQDVSDALEEIIAAKWAEQSLDMNLTDIVFYAEMFGTAGANTLFDKKLRHGKGDNTFYCVDPRNLNFDPSVTSTQHLDKAEYIRVESLMATSWAKNIYNNKEIKADAPFTFIRDRALKQRSGRTTRKVLGNLRSQSAVDRSIIKEYWLADRTKTRGALKYPGGRHIIIAGDTIVIDEPNPYWDQTFPIDIIDWHRNPDSAWGSGEIEDLAELQKLLNKIVALIVENGLLMTNAIWVGDANALEPHEWDELDNVPGLKIKKKPGSELRREAAPPLPAGMFNIVQYLEDAISKLSGNTEVVRGQTPGDVKSGVAIEALQQAAMSLIRLKSRSVENLLERIGQKLISRIFQFESEDRNMWSFKNDEDWAAFQFVSKQLRSNSKYFKNKKDAWKNFMFKIRPGSTMANNKMQEAMLALQLYQAQPKPIIDRKAVHEMLDLPGHTAIMDRMVKDEQAQFEQDLMAQQMLAGGGGGAMPGGAGGSAPSVTNLQSPHANQAVTESVTKGGGGL
jgi:hypothetical protein